MEIQENEAKRNLLISYNKEKQSVRRLEEQLLELQLNKILPPFMKNNKMHGAKDIDLSNYTEKMNEIEQELVTAIYSRLEAFQKVRKCIESMENESEKELLTYRYLCGLKWEEVAVKMGYSCRKLHYLHRDALKHFMIGA